MKLSIETFKYAESEYSIMNGRNYIHIRLGHTLIRLFANFKKKRAYE